MLTHENHLHRMGEQEAPAWGVQMGAATGSGSEWWRRKGDPGLACRPAAAKRFKATTALYARRALVPGGSTVEAFTISTGTAILSAAVRSCFSTSEE